MDSSNANSVPRKRTSLRRCSEASRASSKAPPPARAFVEHHYHDHSRDPLVKSVELVGSRSGGDSVMTRSFPEKLQLLLDTMAQESLEHIVSWQPHGRCFVIHDKNEFVNSIMPRFFMQTKLTSFQRQLNLYGTFQQREKAPHSRQIRSIFGLTKGYRTHASHSYCEHAGFIRLTAGQDRGG